MRINVHLDEVEGGFAVYPGGNYVVCIQESSKLKESDNGVYIRWIAKILEGEYEGKLVSWNCSLQPQSLWFLKTMLEAIEVEWEEDGFELEDCFGLSVGITLSTGIYNEKPQNEVKGFFKVAQ